MISNRSREALDAMIVNALQPFLGGTSTCQLEAMPDTQPQPDTRLAAITLSSYIFRMMVLIGFTDDTATRLHMASVIRKPLEDMTDQEFLDAILETVNMGCGALSRKLAAVFPNIGMSTPNLLNWRCVHHLDMLRLGHVRQFAAMVDGKPLFHVYACVSEYADLDFAYMASREAENTGELEMF